jgi:hypothetical protein
MGRPLNKKYMGNRNIGSTSTTADNGIGGEGVASVSQPGGGVGSFVVSDTYRNFPTLTASAPTIPGGVTALLSPVFEIATVTFSSGGQTNADYVQGLSTTIPNLGGGAIVYITEVASKVTAVDVTTTGTNRGEFRLGDLTGIGLTTYQVLQAPNAGTDLQINVTFRVKRIEVTEQGSGYVTVPSLSWGGHTFTGQTAPSLNVVTLTTDSGGYQSGRGGVNVSTNEENAILAYAYIGGSLVLVDLVKQISTKRYKVRYNGTNYTARIRYDGIADGTKGYTAAEGVELNMIASDGTGTYLVRKLWNRNCTLKSLAINNATIGITSNTAGTVFADGVKVKWTFGSADASTVQIQNA